MSTLLQNFVRDIRKCVDEDDVGGLVELLETRVTPELRQYYSDLELYLAGNEAIRGDPGMLRRPQYVRARRPVWDAFVAAGLDAHMRDLPWVYDDDRFIDLGRKWSMRDLFECKAVRCITKAISYHKTANNPNLILSYSDITSDQECLPKEQLAWSSLPGVVVTENSLRELFSTSRNEAYKPFHPRCFALSKRNRWELGAGKGWYNLPWESVLLTAAYFAHELKACGNEYLLWPDDEEGLSKMCKGKPFEFRLERGEFCIAFMYFWKDPVDTFSELNSGAPSPRRRLL